MEAIDFAPSAPQGNARWYQGCGILRDVWLVRRNGWALDPEDVAVMTELNADGSARVKVRVEGAKVVEPANGELLLGEPNHTGRNRPDYWPARSSYWGLCDLAGFPKDRYYLYRSQWNEAFPTVHLMPDWTWPGKEGRAKMADGTVVTDRKVTAGPAVRYRVTKDFAADGLVFFRIDAVDRDGNRVIACEDAVRVKVSSGTLVATDNGDATDHTPFASPVRRLFRGSLLVIVREAVAGDPTLEVFGASGERGSRRPDFSAGVSVAC